MGDFEDETGVYSGHLKNGVPYGYGIKMYWNDIIYEGFWVNGAKHGRGKYNLNEMTIEGEFIEGNFVECYANTLDVDQLLDMMNNFFRVEFNGKFFEEKQGEAFFNGKRDKKRINIPKNFTCNELTKIKIDANKEIEGIFANGEAVGVVKIYKNNRLAYEGEIKNGYYDGKGTSFNSLGIKYVGEFKKGKYDGKGIAYSKDLITSGDFKNGYEYGYIRMESTDRVFEGVIINGISKGICKLITPKYTYEGELINFIFHGKGKKNFGFYEIEGTFYYGNILNPCNVTIFQEVLYTGHFDESLGFHGHGVIIYTNNNFTLEGDFERMRLIEKRVKLNFGQSSIEGKKPSEKWFTGICRYTSSGKSWIVNLSEHRGMFPYLTQANFLEYERSFKEKPVSLFRKIKIPEGVYNGEVYGKAFHGKGEFVFSNGEMYVGTFFMNKMHGQGSYFYADESVYAGGFADNKKQGKGILTLKDTSVYAGYWNDDLLDGLCIVKLNNQHVETYWNKGKLYTGFKLICNGFSAYGKIII